MRNRVRSPAPRWVSDWSARNRHALTDLDPQNPALARPPGDRLRVHAQLLGLLAGAEQPARIID